MRDINRIVIHCSYTPPSMDIGAETIRDWHVNDNGWDDIGYHYVIDRTIERLFDKLDHIELKIDQKADR